VMLTRSNATLADTRKRLMCTRLCEPAAALVPVLLLPVPILLALTVSLHRGSVGVGPARQLRAAIGILRCSEPISHLFATCRHHRFKADAAAAGAVSVAATTKTGVSRRRMLRQLPAVRAARAAFPQRRKASRPSRYCRRSATSRF
jgi:hypothetical protein